MEYVEDFKNSGLGITTFAKQVGIPKSTFRGWVKDESDLAFGKINLKPTALVIPRIPKTSWHLQMKYTHRT